MGDLQRTRIALDPEAFSLTKHRTKGLHLSEIVRALMLATGQATTPYMREGWTEEHAHAAWVQGFLWEDVFLSTLQYRVKESRGEILRYRVSSTDIDYVSLDYHKVPEIAASLDGNNAYF